MSGDQRQLTHRQFDDFVDLLARLGIRTLGQLAELPASDVAARFGPLGTLGHQLASGREGRLLDERPVPPDLAVVAELDPPAERVDHAAFVAKALADDLQARLESRGLACTRIAIEAETEHGEHLVRLWRHEGGLTPAAIAERARWQLDGWLTGTGRRTGGVPIRPTAGIDQLRLIPDGVVRYAGMQAGLWGELGVADERAHRALVRVQGLLGPDSVFTAVLGGEATVVTVGGKTVRVKVPETTQPGQKLRLKGLGLPGLGDKAPAGDLFVVVDVALPKTLNAATRKAYEELAKLDAQART